MQILLVTGIFPPDIGGPATYVPEIAKALATKGHSVRVITLSDCLNHDDKIYNFEVLRLPRLIFKPWRLISTIFKIIQLGWNADVLFVNGLAMEAVVANLLLRKPMVQKVVGDLAWERARNKGWVKDNFDDFQKQRYGIKLKTLKWLRSWWTKQANRVIVPSNYLGRCVHNWGVSKDKLVVIYNALEIPKNISPAQVPLQTSIKVVTVGRLVPWKHIDRLIEVIAGLKDIGLVIVGDGSLRTELEEKTQSFGIIDRVYFAGQRSKDETLALMAGSDIFVLNSSYEGLPHVVLEAMSLGLPVVATAVGGTPEVVQDGENGYLVKPLDNQGLFKMLSKLTESSELRQCLIEKSTKTIEGFRFEKMITESMQLLESYK